MAKQLQTITGAQIPISTPGNTTAPAAPPEQMEFTNKQQEKSFMKLQMENLSPFEEKTTIEALSIEQDYEPEPPKKAKQPEEEKVITEEKDKDINQYGTKLKHYGKEEVANAEIYYNFENVKQNERDLVIINHVMELGEAMPEPTDQYTAEMNTPEPQDMSILEAHSASKYI